MTPNAAARMLAATAFAAAALHAARPAAAQEIPDNPDLDTPGVAVIAAPVPTATYTPAYPPAPAPAPAPAPVSPWLHVHVDCAGPCGVTVITGGAPSAAPRVAYPQPVTVRAYAPAYPPAFAYPAIPVWQPAAPPPMAYPDAEVPRTDDAADGSGYRALRVLGALSLIVGTATMFGGAIVASSGNNGDVLLWAGGGLAVGGFVSIIAGSMAPRHHRSALSRGYAAVAPTPGGASFQAGLVF